MSGKPPVATRTVAKADASRQRILEASARLFRQRGYSGVSLRDIAAAAGMKAGSVYYHFESKEAIVLAALNIGITAVHEKVSQAVDALPAKADAKQVLKTAMLAHLRSLFQFSDFTSANVRIFREVPEDIRKANAADRRRYERLWTGILERVSSQGALRADIDLKNVRLLLISSLNATLDWLDGKDDAITALADSYSDILLNGVLKPRLKK